MEVLQLIQNRAQVLESILAKGRKIATFKEVAAITGLKETTLRVYAAQRKINVERHGRRAYITLYDLARLI